MKNFNRIFLIVVFCGISGPFSISHLFATHNRAGEITYRWMGGTKYEITVTTYTRTSSCLADRCEIEINFGDNTSKDTIKRTNGGPCPTPSGCEKSCDNCGVLFPSNPDIKINEYKVEHVFPGPGIYIISVDDPNRNADVVNFPNSENTSFYIESELRISPFGGANNSPILDFPPVDIACADVLFEHSPGAHDPDGDSLVYSIVANRGGGGSQITDYSFPNNVPECASSSLTINKSTGLLTWDAPVCCPLGGTTPEHEEFNIAILIEEFRNGKKMGSVLRDMQIEVDCDCENDPPVIIAPNQMCVFAGDTIDTTIVANDINGDKITMTASGEPLSLSNSPAVFPQPAIGDSTISTVFHWNTNCGHVRNNPYTTIFRAEDDDQVVQLVDYHTLEIKIIAPRVENPIAIPEGNSIKLSWDPSPCTASGYSVYRRIDSSGFTVSSCQTGLPSGTGYSLISDCNSTPGTSFTDNNNGLGLVHGQKYCYVVIACLPGAENVVSEEFCAELINDIPIITNVSVFKTDILNGKDSIMWAMPKELDTLQYSPPYQYKIYRSEGFIPASVLIGATSPKNILAFTDTFFIDSISPKTEITPYTYKIELISNGVSVGFTTNASSVFLTSSPTDNALQLNWEEHVPWANSKYFVYKKNSMNSFDFLSAVTTSSFTDTGLVNGEEYCYYVQSLGTYSSPGIIDTILNNSQVHCNKPYDNVPPCQPDTLSVKANCDLFQNTLTWNNPSAPGGCADDVTGYNIYYTPVFGGEMGLIASINSSSDTSFLNDNLRSIAGCYAVSAIDTNLNESPLSDSVCVDNCPEYELPNIFTPGGDGKNDFFRPFPYRFIAAINIQIFNRWGQMVFESTDPDIMWDGKQMKTKKMCPAGVYFYVCQVHEIRLTGIENRLLKGYVHLLTENGGGAVPNN